jgi:hypothetical protein
MDNVNKQNTEDLKKKLNNFINKSEENEKECQGEECFIKQPQDVIERVEKKFITNDGRQLLI